jgi:tRNA(fMet)-specific endonuclease VapC
MICLDTNVVIGLLNQREPKLRNRFEAHRAVATPLIFPAIALFELRYGFAKSVRRAEGEGRLDRLLALGIEIVPFGPDDALHAGEIRVALEAMGTPIGHYDTLIAGQARARGATLVTANTREFDRVPGLLVVDWAR